jgi:hypothetical protein
VSEGPTEFGSLASLPDIMELWMFRIALKRHGIEINWTTPGAVSRVLRSRISAYLTLDWRGRVTVRTLTIKRESD